MLQRFFFIFLFLVGLAQAPAWSEKLVMHVEQSCGCAFDALQVEIPGVGNVPVGADGTVELDEAPEALVALESSIQGFWCPTYACRTLVGQWAKAADGGVLPAKCLDKPLKELPCIFNIPRYFGWV